MEDDFLEGVGGKGTPSTHIETFQTSWVTSPQHHNTKTELDRIPLFGGTADPSLLFSISVCVI